MMFWKKEITRGMLMTLKGLRNAEVMSNLDDFKKYIYIYIYKDIKKMKQRFNCKGITLSFKLIGTSRMQ